MSILELLRNLVDYEFTDVEELIENDDTATFQDLIDMLSENYYESKEEAENDLNNFELEDGERFMLKYGEKLHGKKSALKFIRNKHVRVNENDVLDIANTVCYLRIKEIVGMFTYINRLESNPKLTLKNAKEFFKFAKDRAEIEEMIVNGEMPF